MVFAKTHLSVHVFIYAYINAYLCIASPWLQLFLTLILACHIGGFGIISHRFCQFSIFAHASDIADLHICTYDYFVKIIFILCTYFYCVQFQYVNNHVTDIQICTRLRHNQGCLYDLGHVMHL